MRPCVLGLLVWIVVGTTTPASACTCFSVVCGDTVFVGRNYDWDFSDALVLVNKRGLTKVVSVDPAVESGSWTARWGSVTFNQYGRDYPCGRMNERGLVVEVLWLAGTMFPPADDRLALDSVQWVQYQLDTAASVDEVIASLTTVRVRGTVEIHFYVADRSGQAAAIEFLDGKAVVHRTSASMEVAALTNHTYEQSQAFLRTRQGWGGGEPLPGSSASLHRFARAATAARALETGARPVHPEALFRILGDVAQRGRTQWSIVYDVVHLRLHFRTRKSTGIKSIDLADLDFSCTTPVLMLDIDLPGRGDVARRWRPYTRAANRALIGRTYAQTEFLREVTSEALDLQAAQPQRARCTR